MPTAQFLWVDLQILFGPAGLARAIVSFQYVAPQLLV
jgi:hypothetical protein